MTTFLQARTPKVLAALRAQTLAAMAAAGAPVAGWSPRAPQRVMVDDFAARTTEETEIRAELAAMVDLSDLAKLDPDWCAAWMTWFAEVYIPALPAIWDVPVTTSTSPQTIDPTDVVVLQATGGAIFELAITTPAELAPNGVLRVRARAPGSSGNVSPTSITGISSAPVGLALAGTPTLYTAGRDLETPTAAIRRCLGKWAALGAGWTAEAFDYWIPLAAPTLNRWKVRDDNPIGPGSTLATIARAGGAATAAEVAAVQAKMGARGVRPLGSGPFLARSAAVYPWVPSSAFYATVVTDGSNGAATELDAAYTAFIDAFDLGPTTLYLDALVAALLAVRGAKNVILGGTLAGSDIGTGIDIPDGGLLVADPHFTVI